MNVGQLKQLLLKHNELKEVVLFNDHDYGFDWLVISPSQKAKGKLIFISEPVTTITMRQEEKIRNNNEACVHFMAPGETNCNGCGNSIKEIASGKRRRDNA